MNEKIKELAEQAGFEITPWGNESVPCVHQEGPIDVELEKFAELIVGKCIAQCEQFLDDPDFTIGAMRCAIQLNQYFGVEK